MSIESDKAAARETYQGSIYYFCSPSCQRSFKTDPANFAAKAAPGQASHGAHEHHR